MRLSLADLFSCNIATINQLIGVLKMNTTKQDTATQINGLTQDSLFVFIHDVNEAENELATTRLALFQKQVNVTDMASFKAAAKECAASHKDDKNADVIKSRISETRQLYGAIRFCGLNVSGMGYHNAVKAARDGLAAKSITYDGSPVKTAEQKQAAKDNALSKKAAKEVTDNFDFNQVDAMAIFAEALTDKKAELEQEALIDSQAKAMLKIETHGSKIIAEYGIEYAAALCSWLGNKVAETKKQETKQLKVA